MVLSSILHKLNDGPSDELHVPARTSRSWHEIKKERITPGGLSVWAKVQTRFSKSKDDMKHE